MLSRISYLLWFAALAIVAYLVIHFTRGETRAAQTLTGSAQCRSCHESARSGEQFVIWKNGPHARAFSALDSDSAKAFLAKGTIRRDSCLSCHTTLGRPAANDAELGFVHEGVGCERCHGPGSAYSSFNVMRDRDAFHANGGVSGSLQDCLQCHSRNIGSKEPRCPFQVVDFNPDSAWALIRHPVPEEKEEPDTTLRREDHE